MKRLSYLICFTLVMTLLLAGCQKKQEPDNIDNLPQNNNSEMEEIDPSEMIIDPGITTDGKIDNSLESFSKALGEKGLKLEDKVIKDAASIGALEGFGFNVNGSPLEVYLFDPASSDEKTKENLKTAAESGFITIFGVEINGKTPISKCSVNGSLVLIFPMEDFGMPHPDKEAIVQAFMEV
ncbi:MAG: hypothetical protein ACOX4U_05135 [Anaerovoracaceae bacterium]|jgi:hypothetical protein